MQEQSYGQGAYTPPPAPNPFLSFIQRPRILLVVLAAWALVGFLTELADDSPFFVDTHSRELDGAVGGLALNWEGIPLAVLYLYCARNPDRFHGVFWLALIAQGASFVSNLYHWLVTETFSFESVALPLGMAAGLGTLVFIHLFAPRAESVEPQQALS
jgi:hypothetical protein